MTSNEMSDGLTICARLRKLAIEKPNKPAFVFWDKYGNRTVMSRKAVWEKSAKCAMILRRYGVKKGDVMCNTLLNSQERIISTYGTILAGAASMHGQKLLASGEDMIKNWTDTNCRGMFYDPNEKKGPIDILKSIKSVDATTGESVYKDLPYMSVLIPVQLADTTDPWMQEVENETELFYDDSVSLNDLACIYPTSGTTGFAKMVAHTHGSMTEVARVYESIIGLNEDSIYLNHRSMGWMGGSLHRYPFLGLTRICVDFTFGNPDNIATFLMKIIESEKCEYGAFIPLEIVSITDAIDSDDELLKPNRHRMDFVITGSGPISKEHTKIIGTIASGLKNVYGSTELGILVAHDMLDPESYESGVVGLPGEGVEVKILDDKKNEVNRGCTGEIYIQTPSTAKGYMNMEEATKGSFLKDNWFRTTDIGRIDEKGRLSCFCRRSNAIFHHGYMHYPGWMEARINSHPQIQDSIIVGIPDPKVFEEMCLCVITTPGSNLTADQARDICKNLFLTSAQQTITPIPKHVLFMESFPRNQNGKIDRKGLKEVAIENIKKGVC